MSESDIRINIVPDPANIAMGKRSGMFGQYSKIAILTRLAVQQAFLVFPFKTMKIMMREAVVGVR